MNKIIVCDIDGTIADCSHRLHYIQGENKDYKSFYDEVYKDDPIKPIINLIENVSDRYEIVFLTGRNEFCKNDTMIWLARNIDIFPYSFELLMRKQNNRIPDIEVKPELLEQYLKNNPDSEVAFILEDRNSMVKQWRELGYTCLQVCEGKY